MNFNAFRASNTHRPLFHLGQIPMDATNTLVGLHLLTALIITFASGGWFSGAWIGELIFTPSALQDFRIWTLVTYPFIHGIDLWFALGLYFFWRFGGEIESILGTRRFVRLYGAVTVVPALALFAISPFAGDLLLVGDGSVHFAIFVSFALIYPSAAVWFGIPIKWFVIALLAIQSFQLLGYKSWGGLAGLWLSIITAFTYLHMQGVRSCHSMTTWMLSKLNIKITRSPKQTKRPPRSEGVPPIGQDKHIDAILDKISQSGFQSLTQVEKNLLNDTSSRYTNRKPK